MDHFVLIPTAAALDRALAGCHVDDFRQDGLHRYRLVASPSGAPRRTIVVSLRPERPWIGRPPRPHDGPPWSPSPFARLVAKALEGRRIAGVAMAGDDRIAVLDFEAAGRLIVEMATHGANLVLVGADGTVLGAAHYPRSAHDRIRDGQPYARPRVPPSRISALTASPATVDRVIAEAVREGESLFEALRRRVFGVGSAAAALVVEESEATGATHGIVLARRLEALRAGAVEPVIEAPKDPLEAAAEGPLDPTVFKLLPWERLSPAGGRMLLRGADAAATAGLWHEALERGALAGARADALRALVRLEADRAGDALRRAEGDLEAFRDPERWRREGEALLAGFAHARRDGNRVIVPDPCDPEGRPVVIDAAPGIAFPRLADDLFRRHRRAQRGRETARQRVVALAARRARLDDLAVELERLGAGRASDVESMAREGLGREGVAVGLRTGTPAQRAATRHTLPRLEGVRVYRSRDGIDILVGRTGRDNDRLTFKIAGPEDVWFHARGVPGAHVVVRRPAREGGIPPATIEDAATLAAWFSDARGQSAVDVQWTKRKNVRRARGRGAGSVLLKRSETIRVAPRPPRAEGTS